MENKRVDELLAEYKELARTENKRKLTKLELERYLFLEDFFSREMEHFELHEKHKKDIKEIENKTRFAFLYSEASISVSVIACVSGLAGFVISLLLLFTY